MQSNSTAVNQGYPAPCTRRVQERMDRRSMEVNYIENQPAQRVNLHMDNNRMSEIQDNTVAHLFRLTNLKEKMHHIIIPKGPLDLLFVNHIPRQSCNNINIFPLRTRVMIYLMVINLSHKGILRLMNQKQLDHTSPDNTLLMEHTNIITHPLMIKDMESLENININHKSILQYTSKTERSRLISPDNLQGMRHSHHPPPHNQAHGGYEQPYGRNSQQPYAQSYAEHEKEKHDIHKDHDKKDKKHKEKVVLTFNLIMNRNTRSMVVMAVIIAAADTVAKVIEQHNIFFSLCDFLQHNFSTLVVSASTLQKFLTLLEL